MTENSPNLPTKYTSLNSWHSLEAAKWNSSEAVQAHTEKMRQRRKQRLAEAAVHLTDTSSKSSEEPPSPTPTPKPSPDLFSAKRATPESVKHAPESPPTEKINIESSVETPTEETPETNNSPEKIVFRAITFEEAQALENPLPDTVIERLIESKGQVDLGSFVKPDESDSAVTSADRHSYHEEVMKLPEKYGKTIEGRSNYVPHAVFAQFDSTEYLHKKASGENVALINRIYLNPKQTDRLAVYEDFLKRSEDAGLAVASKIYEAINSEVQTGMFSMFDQLRQDSIVIYASKEDSDKTLALVQDIYKDHAESFDGRTSAPQVCELADGFAVGSEPIKFTGHESLTSLREKLLNIAYKDVMKWCEERSLSPDKERLAKGLKKHCIKLLALNGVDPHNWSFDTNQN